MGFFDLLNPVLDGADGLLSALPAWIRIAVWALLGAAASMGLYRLFSRQEALSALKPQIKAAQKALAGFDGELDELLPLFKRSIGLSMRQFGLALGPALLASIPLIFLLVWMSNRYDLIAPQAGEPVTVQVHETDAELAWSSSLGVEANEDGSWTVAWPAESQALVLEGAGQTILNLPMKSLTPVVHKQQWWNALIGNPGGYLNADAPADWITLEFRSHEYLPFGPSWMRGWEFLFIGLLFAFSLAIKFVFRIH